MLLVVHVLFRTCLLLWINYLLDLSNVSLLGILEHRKDTGATVLTGSILCLQMLCSLSLFYSSLHRVQLLHQNLFLFHYPLSCLHLLMFMMSLHQCHRMTLQNHLHQPLKNFKYIYTHWQNVSASESIPVDSSSSVEGPPPQPSASPSVLDILIALRKGKRSCTDYPITHFVFL